MMLSAELRQLIEQQPGDVKRSNRQVAERALTQLGVSLDSEFAEFYLSYRITLFRSDVSDEQLCDIAEPSPEVAQGTQFARQVWNIPEQYVCFTSVQGEGAYLYDSATGAVWDFSLAKQAEFLAGRERPRWNSFFEFLTWYLLPKAEVLLD